MRRSFWVIQVGPKHHNKHLYKRRAEGDLRHAKEKVMWRQRQSLEQYNSKPRTPKNATIHQKPEKTRNGFPPRNSGRNMALPTPWFQTSVLQNSQSCFEPPSLWYFVTVATGTNIAIFSSSSLSYLWFSPFLIWMTVIASLSPYFQSSLPPSYSPVDAN